MFRAHYAEFDKTMRHENANSIRYVAKKKLRARSTVLQFFPLIVSHRPQKTYWVTGLLGQQLTWKKNQKLQL